MGSVQLVLMRQLPEARRDDDNWTGLREQTKRRKRKAAQKDAKPEDGPKSILRLGVNHAAPETEYNIYSGKKSVIPSTSDLFIPSYLSQTGHVVPVRHLYPISRDHLLPLVEYNIFRGCTTNVLILGYLHLIGSSCRFGDSVPVFPNPYQLSLTHIDLDSESVSSRRFNVPHQRSNIPISLKPTLLPQSMLYPDWIAILPCPRMRDNAIRTQYLFTNSELCADILDGLMGKQNDVGAGAAVWSSSWEPSGWELTERFIRKGGVSGPGMH